MGSPGASWGKCLGGILTREQADQGVGRGPGGPPHQATESASPSSLGASWGENPIHWRGSEPAHTELGIDFAEVPDPGNAVGDGAGERARGARDELPGGGDADRRL